MGQSNKKITLIQIFNTLKEDIESNRATLGDVVIQMFYIDKDIAAKMWLFLLENDIEYLHQDSFDLVFGIVMGCRRDYFPIISALKGNEKLATLLFQESAGCCAATDIISRLTGVLDDYETASKFLSMAYANKYNNDTFYDFLSSSIPDGSINLGENIELGSMTLSKNSYNMYMSWVEKIEDKNKRAKLHLKLMNMIDDIGDNDEKVIVLSEYK